MWVINESMFGVYTKSLCVYVLGVVRYAPDKERLRE